MGGKFYEHILHHVFIPFQTPYMFIHKSLAAERFDIPLLNRKVAHNCLFVLLQRRLQKELMSLVKEPPPGVVIDPESISQNLTQ